jgi:hypothetical protein
MIRYLSFLLSRQEARDLAPSARKKALATIRNHKKINHRAKKARGAMSSDLPVQAQIMDADGSLYATRVDVAWAGEASSVRFVREEENGEWWVILDDVMEALDVPNTRLALQDAFLDRTGPRDEAWTWLRVGREFYRCLRLTHMPVYCDMLFETGQLHGTEAQAANEWATRQLGMSDIHRLAVRRKRRDQGGEEEEEALPEPVQQEDDEYYFRLSGSGGSSEEGEEPRVPPSSPSFMDIFDAEEDEEEDGGPTVAEFTFNDIRRLSDLHSQRIQTCAMMMNALPEDNPERVHLQVAMHNSNAVLDAVHPVTNPRKLRRVVLPAFPPVGRQVRVSERIRAMGYDYDDVSAEDMMTIGQHAAAFYRAGPYAGPWAVTAWAGDRRVVRFHYTEETQHYIDDAIRVVLGPPPAQ